MKHSIGFSCTIRALSTVRYQSRTAGRLDVCNTKWAKIVGETGRVSSGRLRLSAVESMARPPKFQ